MKKSFLVYDDSCGFCTKSIQRMQRIIGDQIDYIGRSKFNAQNYNLHENELQKSIKYIEYNPVSDSYELHSGARAIFGALANNLIYSLPLTLYKHLPLFAFISEKVYSWIAANRQKISNLCTVSKPKI